MKEPPKVLERTPRAEVVVV